MEQVQDNIARYLDALARADREESDIVEPKAKHLTEKIAQLRAQLQDLAAREEEVRNAPDQQVSLTEPDARAMAAKAKDAMGVGALDIIAHKGYFKGEDIRTTRGHGRHRLCAQTSGSQAQGRFGKPDFVYLEQKNVYRCTAGADLIYRYTSVEDGLTMHSYWSSNCQTCAPHDQCTTGKERRVKRWEHEAVIEAMERRLDRVPEAMRIRRQTAEHRFGTRKSWMGSTHFQMKTLKHVRTEASLHILAYNFKRLVAILGVGPMIVAIRT